MIDLTLAEWHNRLAISAKHDSEKCNSVLFRRILAELKREDAPIRSSDRSPRVTVS